MLDIIKIKDIYISMFICRFKYVKRWEINRLVFNVKETKQKKKFNIKKKRTYNTVTVRVINNWNMKKKYYIKIDTLMRVDDDNHKCSPNI